MVVVESTTRRASANCLPVSIHKEARQRRSDPMTVFVDFHLRFFVLLHYDAT